MMRANFVLEAVRIRKVQVLIVQLLQELELIQVKDWNCVWELKHLKAGWVPPHNEHLRVNLQSRCSHLRLEVLKNLQVFPCGKVVVRASWADDGSRFGRKECCGQALARWFSEEQVKQDILFGNAAQWTNFVKACSSMSDHDIVLSRAMCKRKAVSYRNQAWVGYDRWRVDMKSWYTNNSGINDGWKCVIARMYIFHASIHDAALLIFLFCCFAGWKESKGAPLGDWFNSSRRLLVLAPGAYKAFGSKELMSINRRFLMSLRIFQTLEEEETDVFYNQQYETNLELALRWKSDEAYIHLAQSRVPWMMQVTGELCWWQELVLLSENAGSAELLVWITLAEWDFW